MKLRHQLLVIFALMGVWHISAFAQQSASGIDTLNSDMLEKVRSAQTRLKQTEKDISQARAKLAKTLNALEKEVLALRESTSVARRKNDEKTLGLNQLENRLAQWQEQQVFQENLINRYLMQAGENAADLQRLSLSQKVDALLPLAKSALEEQSPQFKSEKVVMPSGELTQAQTLSLGPVTWFITPTGQSGVASVRAGLNHADVEFNSDDTEQLSELKKMNTGTVIFDPTLGRAATQQQSGESLQQHVTNGGLWVIPIIVFGVVAISIALFKVIQLWRLPRVKTVVSSSALANIIQQSSVKEFVGMQRELVNIAQRAPTASERDDELFGTLQQFKYTLEKYNGAIAVTAAVAPLLGLLGTVSGMIETFRMMTAFGSSDPEIISGGIAKALVTTELGLVVAIPALILNAVLSRKAKRYYDGLEAFALVISSDEKAQSNQVTNPHYVVVSS